MKLVYLIKNTRFLYLSYFYIIGTGIKILRLFIHPRKDKILFVSFGGKKYDDNPRAVFEAMRQDSRFSKLDIVWGLTAPSAHEIHGARKVKVDTLSYFIEALRCGIWITNSSVERGLGFKPRKTFCLNTWHGTPIKHIGCDMPTTSKQFKSKSKSSTDIYLTQSQYDANTLSHASQQPLEKFAITGYPRNDELVRTSADAINNIRRKLNIKPGKKVIMYAPTFREYELGKNKRCVFKAPVDFEKWRTKLGDEYVVLFRAHYEVALNMHIKDCESIKDVSAYPHLNDLMLITDILISDYSSIFFDFSITGKPMLCFAYDYDRYNTERGLYFDIREELGNSETESQLLDEIVNLDWEQRKHTTKIFRDKYVTEYGNAGNAVLDILAARLNL